MSALLKIVIKVIQRRVNSGEYLDSVLLTYPGLKENEKEIIRKSISIN